MKERQKKSDYEPLRAHLRCLRITPIEIDDDPFTIYQAGNMTKGKLIDIVVNSLYEFTAKEKQNTCKWTIDLEAYTTQCGGLFEITYGSPEENNMNFCPYCGGILITSGGIR